MLMFSFESCVRDNSKNVFQIKNPTTVDIKINAMYLSEFFISKCMVTVKYKRSAGLEALHFRFNLMVY